MSRGQSLVEFAVILPLMLLFVGVVLDVSRLYFGWINLEAATRDAAQAIATSNIDSGNPTYSPAGENQSTNNATATAILDAEVGRTFTAVAPPLGTACATPAVTTNMSYSTSSNGGTTSYPAGQATVTTCLPFQTLFPYPFFTLNGSWILQSEKQFTTLVGR